MDTMRLKDEALQLPEIDRALLADRLYSSLLNKSSKLEEAWATESEDRLAAFHRGELQAVDGVSALAKLREKFAK